MKNEIDDLQRKIEYLKNIAAQTNQELEKMKLKLVEIAADRSEESSAISSRENSNMSFTSTLSEPPMDPPSRSNEHTALKQLDGVHDESVADSSFDCHNLECDICNLEFPSFDDFNEHNMFGFMCAICDICFKTEKDANCHVEDFHPGYPGIERRQPRRPN